MKKKKNGNKNNYSYNLDLAYERIAKEKVEKQEKELSTRARIYEEICSLVGEPTLLDSKGRIRFSFKQSVDFLMKKFNAFEVSIEESFYYVPNGETFFELYRPRGEDALNALSGCYCSEDMVSKVLIVPIKWKYLGPHTPSKEGEAIYLVKENDVLRYVWMSPLYKCCDTDLAEEIAILTNNCYDCGRNIL